LRPIKRIIIVWCILFKKEKLFNNLHFYLDILFWRGWGHVTQIMYILVTLDVYNITTILRCRYSYIRSKEKLNLQTRQVPITIFAVAKFMRLNSNTTNNLLLMVFICINMYYMSNQSNSEIRRGLWIQILTILKR